MDAFPQNIKTTLLYPIKYTFTYYLLQHTSVRVNRTDAPTQRRNDAPTQRLGHCVPVPSCRPLFTHTHHRHTTQHDISQTSTPTRTTSRLHTFSHSSLHTHLTHTTRTTNPSDAQTMQSQLTSLPSQVTNTSSHTFNTHLTPTFTSAIPPKTTLLFCPVGRYTSWKASVRIIQNERT